MAEEGRASAWLGCVTGAFPLCPSFPPSPSRGENLSRAWPRLLSLRGHPPPPASHPAQHRMGVSALSGENDGLCLFI